MKPPRLRRVAATGLLLAAFAAPACNKAVDLGDLVGSIPGAAKVTADFQPEPVTPGVTQNYVALQKGMVSHDQITIDVAITDVSVPVSGLVMKLSYDTSVAHFAGCSDGTLFQAGTCYNVEQPPGSGVVFVGRSITAPEAAVSVSGTRTVVRLAFRVTHAGQGAIVLEAQNVGGGDSTALLDSNGDPILVTWFEGNLVGN